MKNLYFYLLLTPSVFANDPTMVKGKLKEVLFNSHKQITKNFKPEKKPLEKVLKIEKPSKELQENLKLLNFKAFYSKNSVNRLMVEFEQKIIFLEAQGKIVLNGETYILDCCDNCQAQFTHLSSQKKITFNYRP
ncbi:hypothetical protein PQO03_03960 [Lentisphaera profundi]|uniref:Organic solvent tolerance-like N-terminal domain-containing protein n=1 Tax=Lentisphaera profundi TaxID=1658616 RepID=A0ABY7VT80_9BACT|nr:hypothetical protein [Lentisphaera profundi]WDE97111.1 hypothetical protein PQO03_03960 [Lentisphaera profundi]